MEEALEGIEEAAITRDEQRELERRVRGARKHAGETCTLEMAFDYNSHLYVYEVQPDWYEEFLEDLRRNHHDACPWETVVTPKMASAASTRITSRWNFPPVRTVRGQAGRCRFGC